MIYLEGDRILKSKYKIANPVIKAVFFDRDGTLNLRKRDGYIGTPGELEVFPELILLMKKIFSQNIQIAIITNQQGIGKEIFNLSDFFSVQSYFSTILERNGITSHLLFFCPHLDSSCTCRKPLPGMLRAALTQLNLLASEVIFIGDSITDMSAAQKADILGIHINSEFSEQPECECFALAHASIGSILNVAQDLIAKNA